MTREELVQKIQPQVVAALDDLADFLERLTAAQKTRAAWQANPVGDRPQLPSKTVCPDTIDRGDATQHIDLHPDRIRATRDWYAAQTDPQLILFCLHLIPKDGPMKAGSLAQYYAAAYKIGRAA